MKRFSAPRGLCLALPLLLAVPVPAAADVAVLERDVEYLAAERLEGRLTGSAGEREASAYLKRELERLGAQPLPGQTDTVLPFAFTAGTADAGSSIALTSTAGKPTARRFKGTRQVRALSFSEAGQIAGPVVFAGYGLTVPESQDLAYDSFAGLDVKGKIVLVLRYAPEDADPDARATLSRYAGLRYKALRARELGAVALVVATGPRSPHAGETIPETFDAALAGSGIVAASVGGAVADEIVRLAGRSLADVQQALDTGNPHAGGFDIPGLTLSLTVKIRRERRTGHNVIGWLPATVEPQAQTPAIVLGAHYDHLGRGRHGNSLASKDQAGQIHRGADDNASGVAAVLALGRRLASEPRRHPVALAFWSGEELGLLGSSHVLKQGLLTREQILAYVNFDMVGRMRDQRLDLQGAGSSSAWSQLIEATNVPFGLDVRVQDDPFLPTDSSSFYQAELPTLSFFTGSHEDYHRPSDLPERLNYEGLARIVDFAALLTRKLDAREAAPDYRRVERTRPAGGDRDSLRAFTGTIPDYTTEVAGLRLGGVVGGGPADRAGLREGDVIVEFAGRAITNIYDYTYALDAVKIGQSVRVVVMREGQRVEAEITPTSRP